jgi:TQXA domain-containing protein
MSAPLPASLRTPLAPAAPVTVRRRVQPRAAVDLSRLTRYRGGTYSHTVEFIRFVDGSTARTDLIRLNPGVEAYSLDFSAEAPTRPSPYQAQTFSEVPNLRARAYEVEIDWILRNSFPSLRVTELSRRLRAAGYPLGPANISEHQAIAGTQAAIWHLTNGMDLDNRPLNVPVREERDGRGVTVEFDGTPELGGYTVEVAAGAPVTVTLHKSIDGRRWQAVESSRLTVPAGSGTHRKTLGVGATVSSRHHGRGAEGHRYYRITVDGPATIGDLGFWLAGSGNYRNPERIVHLYNFLLDGARKARARSAAPALSAARARYDAERGLVGPFRLRATSAVALTSEDADIVDEHGETLANPVEVGTVFHLRPQSTSRSSTVTVTVPGTADGHGGRVITGVARDDASQRLTPVALVVPMTWVVDFEIDW